MDLLNAILGIITIISVILTVYYGQKSARLEKERNKIDWVDMQLAAKSLAKKLHKAKFIPDIIFTPGVRGATFANLLENELASNKVIPIFVGTTLAKESKDICESYDEYEKVETTKWVVLIPKCILATIDKKVLIVDDYVMTGDFLQNTITLVLRSGLKKKNIKSMALAITKTTIDADKSPDFYWHITKDPKFLFPWGEAK